MYVPPYVDAVQWKGLKDHTYSLPACPSSVFPAYDDNFFSTIPFTQLHKEDLRLENDDDNVDGHVSDTDDEVDHEDLDPHWKFPPKENTMAMMMKMMIMMMKNQKMSSQKIPAMKKKL